MQPSNVQPTPSPARIPLDDRHAIPQLGLGVWQIPDVATAAVVREAIAVGYRSIDTAALYHNERGVGEGLRAADVPRDALFVTTKLWHDRHTDAERALDESLRRLGLDHVDLYLIHWPAPRQNRYVDAWRALVRARASGRARSIGVSNFNPDHLERIIDATGVVPALNQVELHPRFQQRALRALHARIGIATESWSPLGQGAVLDDPTIVALARKHGKTPAQVVIRWHLDSGLITIPKTAHPRRMRENFDVFDFALDADDMARIAAMDAPDGRLGFDPATFS
jgi:2,5-diketo-D-gluconate reductase A